MIFRLYQFLTFVAWPFISLYLLYRKSEGKEDTKRFKERSGYAASPRPKNSLIWVHAASVGESLSVLSLIEQLSTRYDGVSILLTTGTVTSAKLVESRLPDSAFHQYVPVDSPVAVRRFLKHWRPSLALWVESELWPNLVIETAKYCPIMLVNARMSDDSYTKWQRFHSLVQLILSRFTLALAQTEKDAQRLEELGIRNAKITGNIKYDAQPLPADPKKMGELVSEIGDRPVWLAASTHPGEEEIAISAHSDLLEESPELLTIIVPRHPKRSKDIVRDVQRQGLKVAVRSEKQPITSETNVYVADTMGELGIFYRLVPIVLIGGSLVEHGGQNPLEAARLDCSIICGPHMDNFTDIRREFEQKDAIVKLSRLDDLTAVLQTLISDSEKQHSLADAALEVVASKNGVVEDYINELAPYIEKIVTKNKE